MRVQRSLEQIEVGRGGTVLRVDAHDARTRQRLMEMGLTPGVRVTVKRVAPLGDPIEIELRGYRLSLRREDARSIAVLPGMQERSGDGAARERETGLPIAKNGALAQGLTEQALGCAYTKTSCCGKCGGCGSAEPSEQTERNGARLAIAGNPNCGKTTLFNALTGARETVGNWPGVTVERKEGRAAAGRYDLTLVDLPGVYSLTANSTEETVAREYLLSGQADAVLIVADAVNLERNLYLTLQIASLGSPAVLALNMMDEAASQGLRIDCARLAGRLGLPVVPVSARTGQGLEALTDCLARLLDCVQNGRWKEAPLRCPLNGEAERRHAEMERAIGAAAERNGIPTAWAAEQLLLGTAGVEARLAMLPGERLAVTAARNAFSDTEMDAAAVFADARYRAITAVCRACVFRSSSHGRSATERIDAVLTHKVIGLPLFFALMSLIFLLTFDTLGAFLSTAIESLAGDAVMGAAGTWLANAGAPAWLASLLTEGVLGGVGSVLTFLPQIALLFFFLSLLEDSGYLARAAFLMDRALKRFGLSGKAFIPVLMGFGCTVPATLAARTMENEGERRMTILLLPFVSCSAKLPVYGLLAGAFFSKHRGLIVLSLYLLGLVMGVLTGLLFRQTVFSENRAPFVLELPPYRAPSLKITFLHVGERVWHFVSRAGTVILCMSVLLWTLTHFDVNLTLTEQTETSLLGLFGVRLAPLFGPLGFASWQAAVALLTGLVAKEAVSAALTLFLGVAGSALPAAIAGLFTPLSAYCFLVFVLLYPPCAAAVATMRRELHSARLTLLMVIYQTGTAFLLAALIYRIGSILLPV